MTSYVTWKETDYERALAQKLALDIPTEKNRLLSLWNDARDFLVPHVLEEIKATEPDLTDHGPRHIANVLDNAYHLLHAQMGASNQQTSAFLEMTAHEAFVLGFAIMYHDVGNIFSREKHNTRVQTIFTEGFTKYKLDTDLRLVVNDIASAHTGGKDTNGQSIDTLSAVDPNGLWSNRSIRTQHLAAILRFADELAEGPQRASILRLRNELPFNQGASVSPDSVIYHEYAQCVSPQIDRAGQRILVRLNIDLANFTKIDCELKVKSILDEFWKRMHTLNQERQYARYYSDLLAPFKAVSIQVRFYNQGTNLPVVKQHVFNDLIVPQKPSGQWKFENCPHLDTSQIWIEVQKCMEVVKE